MPREKESYRPNLERINEKFATELIKVSDVAEWLGIDIRTARKRYSFKDGYISKSTLAREMP